MLGILFKKKKLLKFNNKSLKILYKMLKTNLFKYFTLKNK